MRDNRLLDGRAIRDRILGEVAERVKQAAATHPIGRLVSVSIGEHKEVAVYVRGQAHGRLPLRGPDVAEHADAAGMQDAHRGDER